MRSVLAIVVGTILAVGTARAQQQVAGPTPVDQAVGDLDPLATSLRQVQPGLSSIGGQVRVYRYQARTPWANLGLPPVDAGTGLNLPQGYRYDAPGVRAWMTRPDYLVQTGPGRYDLGVNVAPVQDGAYLEIAPAGVVYDLVPRRTIAQPRTEQPQDDWVDRRINGRIDTRINGRVEPHTFSRRINGSVIHQPTMEPTADQSVVESIIESDK